MKIRRSEKIHFPIKTVLFLWRTNPGGRDEFQLALQSTNNMVARRQCLWRKTLKYVVAKDKMITIFDVWSDSLHLSVLVDGIGVIR